MLFALNTTLSFQGLKNIVSPILSDRFRTHSFTDFEANCDLRGDLHGEFSPTPIDLLLLANSHYNSVSVVDVLDHLRLVDGHPLYPCPVLCIT